MPKYVSLLNWTEQGVRTAKDTTKRSEQARQLIEQLGGRMETVLWTQGRYDVVVVFDAPDDEAAAAVMMGVCGMGAVRSETLRGFDAEEMSRILQRLG